MRNRWRCDDSTEIDVSSDLTLLTPDHRNSLAWYWIVALTLFFCFYQALPDVVVFTHPFQYVPLHSMLELLSIVVSGMVFALAWNIRSQRTNSHFMIVGAGFLAVALIDVAHVLSFPGMPDFFTSNGMEKTVNFWLTARCISALVLLSVALRPDRRWTMAQCNVAVVAAVALAVAIWWGLTIFAELLPRTYSKADGLTTFKIAAEYTFTAAYAVSAILLWQKARRSRDDDLLWLGAAAWTMGLSELFFTLFIDMSDTVNIVGHVYKAIAYLMVYRALFVAGVKTPYRRLKVERARLQGVFDAIPDLLFECGLDGKIFNCSTSLLHSVAVPPQDAIGKRFDEIFTPESAAVCLLALQEAHQTGASFGRQYTLDLGSDCHYYELSVARTKITEAGAPHFVVIARDITDRKHAEFDLIHEKAVLEAIFKGIPDAIVYADIQRKVVNINPAFSSIFGFEMRDLTGKPTSFFYENMEEYEEQGRIRFNRSAAQESHPYVVNYRKKNGAIFSGDTLGTVIKTDNGTILGYIGVIRDITERKHNESRLQLAASVFTHAREGIFITDATGNIVDVNDMFTQITGYSRDDVLGKNPRLLQSGRQDRAFYAAVWKALTTDGHWSGEIWNRRKNGEVYAEILTISAVHDQQGKVRHYVALFSDITAIKEHQKQLEHIAHYDTLTGLPTRLLLNDRLRQAIVHSQHHQKVLAVAYLDLDNIKGVNDHYGHQAGDVVLIAVSGAMQQALREGDTLARIGGDEFVAILVDLNEAGDCIPVIERLLEAAVTAINLPASVQAELTEPTQCVQVSASIGVTFYPQDDVDADVLLRHADQAMYLAKQGGKNRYHLFDIANDAAIQSHHEELHRLSQALDRGEFVLYYQPKVNMRTGDVTGAEALIRWQHPERGLLSPGLFLPIIDDHPLSIVLGEWVIATALAQMSAWKTQGVNLCVSVNIGALQLQQQEFPERLREILAAYSDVNVQDFQLEILETSALEDIARVTAVMHACRAIGVVFALDDFGTGYSSLTYLKNLPAETLKIDQSFVLHMIDDADDLAIVKGVIGLADVFHRHVIAEGVETKAHGDLLMAIGCDLAQGYGVARPMPAKEIPGWVAKWQACATWTA